MSCTPRPWASLHAPSSCGPSLAPHHGRCCSRPAAVTGGQPRLKLPSLLSSLAALGASLAASMQGPEAHARRRRRRAAMTLRAPARPPPAARRGPPLALGGNGLSRPQASLLWPPAQLSRSKEEKRATLATCRCDACTACATTRNDRTCTYLWLVSMHLACRHTCRHTCGDVASP